MNQATFMRYIDAYNNGDLNVVASYYSDDVVLETFGVRHNGADAMRFLEQLHRGVKDHITPTKISIDGDDIVAELETQITALVDLPDLPAGAMRAGEQRTVRMRATYKTKGDKICEVRTSPPSDK